MNKLQGGGKLPPKPPAKAILRGFIGGFIGIFVLAFLWSLTDYQLLMAPFGATCVILFAASALPVAQPRNVVGGHVLSAAIGFAAFYLISSQGGEVTDMQNMLAMAIGVGAAISGMQFFRVVHPPAGANPLVIIMAGVGGNAYGFDFMIFPVLLGSVLLVGIAAAVNNISTPEDQKWPVYWFGGQ